MKMNPDKFSIAQMTSNSNGKTSGSGTGGLYLVFLGGVVGALAAVAGLFFPAQMGQTNEVANVLLWSSATLTLGAGLLGYRKSQDKNVLEKTTITDGPPASEETLKVTS